MILESVRFFDSDLGSLAPDLHSPALRCGAFVARAQDYVGCFHPSGRSDSAVLLRGLDILRCRGALARKLAPVVLRSTSATVAAWLRAKDLCQEDGSVATIDCVRGWLVIAGQAHPADSEDFETWCRRALEGDWRCLVGADGAYSCVLHDQSARRIAFAQDRFGFLRQVYTRVGNAIWFASSMNALAAVPELKLEINPQQVVALGINLYRPAHDSVFQDINRPLPNTGHLLSAELGRPPEIHRGRGYFPRQHRRGLPEPAELVEQLNQALLARLRKILARPDVESLGLWLTSGLDSRWIAAGLKRLGATVSYWNIGTPGTLDFETAQAYAERSGVPLHVARVDSLDDVVGPLPETNWLLEGHCSFFYQFTGNIWEELRALGPVMLQGCHWNWLKWLLPKHKCRRADQLDRRRSFREPMDAFVESSRSYMRRFKAHLLFPEATSVVEESVRWVLAQTQPKTSVDLLLARELDIGIAERSVSLNRMARTLGGAEAPLNDMAVYELELEATRLPYAIRRTIQPRCICALDPASADLPSTPWSLPPRAMTGSVARAAAHAVGHPGWLAAMLRRRQEKTIFAYPIRMRLLGTRSGLDWARGVLREGDVVANAFGSSLERFCNGVRTDPTHKSVGFLYGLASLELYARAWRRAAAGRRPCWEPLELPAQ